MSVEWEEVVERDPDLIVLVVVDASWDLARKKKLFSVSILR